jgi:ATP-dependent Clp protease ATP-binding subunit ClpA
MSRLIHEKIKQPLANEILFGKLADGGSSLVEVKDDDLILNKEKSKSPVDAES